MLRLYLTEEKTWDHDKCVRPMKTKHKIRLESHIIREGQHVKRDIIFIFCLWSYLLNFVLLANLLSWSAAIYIYIHILLLVCTNNFFSSTLTGCSLFCSELLSLEILTIGTSQLSLPSKSYRLLLPLKIIYDHLTITLRTSICTLRSVCSRVVSLQNTTTVSHYYPYSPL